MRRVGTTYTRLPAALGDELGGLSTSLGLFASPLLILSAESVVAMEWKGMSTHVDCNPGGVPVDLSTIDARRKRKIGTARAHELGLR